MNNSPGRLVIYLVAFASVFVILFGIRETATIITPILLAGVITITVLPIPSRLTRRGLPGWLALVLTILLVVLILGLVILTVFFSITRLANDLPAYMADAAATAAEELPAEVTGAEPTPTESELVIQYGPLAQQVVSITVDLLVQFGLALAIFFFMISAAISLPGAARLGLDPDAPIIGRVSSLTGDVRRYMAILTGINFLVGLGNTIFLLILGVDYAVLWGLLGWFMGYIPSIGFWIALIPPVILAYAQYGLQTALVVFIGYVVINGGVQNFVQPKVMGQSLRISPVVVFVGLFVWGYLLGGIGAILSVPLTLIVLIIMENFEGTRMVAVLMRYTGEAKVEERKKAIEQIRGVWDKARATFTSDRDPDDVVD
jgi:predicted PurR-regulated permease PerM